MIVGDVEISIMGMARTYHIQRAPIMSLAVRTLSLCRKFS
jgi:hypothetical protein